MKKLLLSLSLIALSSTINAQWTSQATGFNDASRGLSEIRIVDANTVWGLAYDGSTPTPPATTNPDIQEFTLTTNGGASWNPGVINLGNTDLSINNISPVSGTTAWVSALVPANGGGAVYKTSNSGVNWNIQNATAYTSALSFLDGVYFWNANVGFSYGDPKTASAVDFECYRTIDGGTTWAPLDAALPNITAGDFGYNGSRNIVVAGNTLWFTTAKGKIYRTTDQGVTWTKLSSPIPDFGALDTTTSTGNLYMSDNNNGIIVATLNATAATPTYNIYKTTNGGTSWTTAVAFTGTRFILSYIPGTSTVVATSQAAPVGTSISSDNGTTWTDLEPTGTTQRGASNFLNASTGWCAGFSTDAVTNGIYKLTSPLGTPSFDNAGKFKVYPNPATSTVTISASNVDSYNLSVTDLTGKIVMTKSLNGIENTLDISTLSTGAYFFNLSSDNKKEVIKILKN